MRMPGLVLVLVTAALMAGPAAADITPPPARPTDWDDHPLPLPPPPPEKDPLPVAVAVLFGLAMLSFRTGQRRSMVPG